MSIDIENFYERQYPELKPFVGERFGKDGMPAILLIAESHYVPEDEPTKQHLEAGKWYASNHGTTSDRTRQCIFTSFIFSRDSKKARKSIHETLPKEINNNGPHLSNAIDLVKHLAFYNFYLRPARQFKHPTQLVPTPLDVEYANAAFSYWVRALNPSAIAFVSRNAWNYLDKSRLPSVPCVSAPHPMRPHWNRRCKKYGGKTGRELFADFIKKLPWPKS